MLLFSACSPFYGRWNWACLLGRNCQRCFDLQHCPGYKLTTTMCFPHSPWKMVPYLPKCTSPACCACFYPSLMKTCKQYKIVLHWTELQIFFHVPVNQSSYEKETAGGLPPENPWGCVISPFLQSVQSWFNKLVIILWWSALWCWFALLSEVFFYITTCNRN